MNNNFKNDKFVEVVQEFQIVQGQSVYQIGSIDLKDVYFFVKNGNENYKVLATGQYTVDGINLTINDPNIILTNTHIQVCRVYSTVASKYISDVVNINTLREHYNVLVDDFINVIDFLRKSGIKSDSSAMNYVFPLLEEGQVFMRKGLGFEGRQIMDINGELQLQINKAVEIFEKYLNEQKKPEIDNYIGEKETELENRLEIFTQEKIQQINDVGLKLEINQTNHGFLFDAVQYDVSRGIYIKASAAYGADGMAIRINSNKFYLVSNGLVKVPDLAVDSGGRAYVMDEFYFLDNYIAGGCTPEKPTNIFQPLFCIVDKDGIKSALIQVDAPIDLEPREITELGLPNKENTIEDLIKSRKYKVGDVVQVLGYYSAGDGAGHPRIKKPVGYTGADAVIGADGSIWGIVHSGEVNVSWLGAKGDGVSDDSASIQKAIDLGSCIYFNSSKTFLCSDVDINKSNIVITNANFKKTTNGNYIFSAIEKENISIANCLFDGVNDAGIAIKLMSTNDLNIDTSCKNIKIENCVSKNFNTDLLINGAIISNFTNNNFRSINNIIIKGKSLENNFIGNSLFGKSEGNAISIIPSENRTSDNNYAEGQYFFGNTIEAGRKAIYIECGLDITFVSNWIGKGYHTPTHTIHMSRNTTTNSRMTNFNFTANEISDCLVEVNNNQSEFSDYDLNIVDDFNFNNNTFRFELDGKIVFGGAGTLHSVNNNTFYIGKNNTNSSVIDIRQWINGKFSNNLFEIRKKLYTAYNLISCKNVVIDSDDWNIKDKGNFEFAIGTNFGTNGNVIKNIKGFRQTKQNRIAQDGVTTSFTTEQQIIQLDTGLTYERECEIKLNLNGLTVLKGGFIITNLSPQISGLQYIRLDIGELNKTVTLRGRIGSNLILRTDNALQFNLNGYYSIIEASIL